MQVKKIAGWAVVIFLAYFLVTRPADAATAVHHLFNGLMSAGSSLATFVTNL